MSETKFKPILGLDTITFIKKDRKAGTEQELNPCIECSCREKCSTHFKTGGIIAFSPKRENCVNLKDMQEYEEFDNMSTATMNSFLMEEDGEQDD